MNNLIYKLDITNLDNVSVLSVGICFPDYNSFLSFKYDIDLLCKRYNLEVYKI